MNPAHSQGCIVQDYFHKGVHSSSLVMYKPDVIYKAVRNQKYVCNLLHLRQRRTELQPQIACMENFTKFTPGAFEICQRTDRQMCQPSFRLPNRPWHMGPVLFRGPVTTNQNNNDLTLNENYIQLSQLNSSKRQKNGSKSKKQKLYIRDSIKTGGISCHRWTRATHCLKQFSHWSH